MSVADVRARILLRAQGCCERCGNRLSAEWPGWSLHHRRPRGMGGTKRPDVHSPANILALCGTGTTGCHGWVEANRFEARRLGFLVGQAKDPAQVPVARVGGDVYLTPDGGLMAADLCVR